MDLAGTGGNGPVVLIANGTGGGAGVFDALTAAPLGNFPLPADAELDSEPLAL